MFEKDLLKNRTILITGGGTGLGRSMALRFAELGANLFLVGRREDPLKETCRSDSGEGNACRVRQRGYSRFRCGGKCDRGGGEGVRPPVWRNRYGGEQRSGEFSRAHGEALAQCV